VTQTLEGVDRVGHDRARMKEFAHPENKGMVPADLNKALLNTLTVARKNSSMLPTWKPSSETCRWWFAV